MTTSISSEAFFVFCSLTDRPTDKIFVEWMLKYKRKVHTKNESFILYRGREITFPPKPDIQTYIQTDGN